MDSEPNLGTLLVHSDYTTSALIWFTRGTNSKNPSKCEFIPWLEFGVIFSYNNKEDDMVILIQTITGSIICNTDQKNLTFLETHTQPRNNFSINAIRGTVDQDKLVMAFAQAQSRVELATGICDQGPFVYRVQI